MKLSTLALALCLAVISQGTWASPFYCGNVLVYTGDTMRQVYDKCGEPYQRDSRVEYRRTILNWVPSREAVLQDRGITYLPGVGYVHDEPINIDEWVYNFGPGSFMQFLHFVNGQLTDIKDLGYGN